jgi:type IV secretory pathway VirB9-like protein
MKLRWLIPFAVLLPLRLGATGPAVSARVATITINPNQVTALHLRPEFESTIRMPEEITSVILGSPSSFKAEHNEGEPQYVYVKPITKGPVQSNLLIATKSGQHVTLELISDGASANNANQPVDFLIEYRVSRSFLVVSDAAVPAMPKSDEKAAPPGMSPTHSPSAVPSAIDQEFEQQTKLNAPKWTKWDGKQIETSIGDIRQWSNETVVSYSIYNSSDQPVEIVAPQIQITGRKTEKKKKKEGKGILSDQLEIRDYKLSVTRLEPGGRADGVVVFDRPNFKQSTEKLFLQLAQADQVDRPILIRLPFTPPIAAERQ